MDFHNKPKPDDRSNNVERLQTMIGNTIENMNEAEETMNFTENKEERERIATKNERRQESIKAMRAEIEDETEARQNGYK
ncbi:small acid-soluble spore protein Tlp [Bacillus sp. Bva_UNVM-123]|uniref:small acid-soluble spore protein Tlp n=1 Tax=Bacillus sp. Bva_UNVM-123 TaxID=2829798 RepID=UPI00391F116C